MRSGAAHDRAGFFHEAALYRNEDEFLSIVVPFVRGGAEAGEPTIVSLGEAEARLARTAIGALEGVTFVQADARSWTPAARIRSQVDAFEKYVAAGAEQIRVVGDVPHPGRGVRWDSWARYEATLNHAFKDFPVWGLCAYDARTTPTFVLDEVLSTHPHVASPDGRHSSTAAYTDPATFLANRRPRNVPIVPTGPMLRLVDPRPAHARDAIRAFAGAAGLHTDDVIDLELAVTEMVTNATLYGHPPVTVCAWSPGPHHVAATITDTGAGVTDPFAGLLPVGRGEIGGRGLWIAHQTCGDVNLIHDERGFTVELLVGGRSS